MNIPIRFQRIGFYVSLGIFAVAFLFALGMFLRTEDMQQAFDVRRQTRESLAELETTASELRRISDAWSVASHNAEEIGATVEAVMPVVDRSDPVMMDSQQLHRASLEIPAEPSEEIFQRLTGLHGLPVRITSIDLTADESGNLGGTIDVVWLERF